MLLLLLTCLLPTAGGKGCLRCWPELPALLNYDLQILWGSPGPPAELSQSLQSLFLEEDTLAKTAYLDRNHLEEATAKFFNELDQAIKKWRDDKPLLLEEVHMYKSLLAEKLTERSGELKERACNESCDIHTPLEITECANCGTHFFSCDDPALCPAKHRRNHKLALGISTILLVALAGGGCYALWLRKKKKEEAEKEQGKHMTLRDEQKLQSPSRSSLISSPNTASSRDPFHPGHPRW
ncbi:testis-expressed protein 51 isoform X4 [Oryctolagus cuniculus]|uniref:testis-expressed protein 51 isoform X4 n=1 Tax=Oryctolagus cuniculus TaxID=9986 RepID=UPI00048B53EF|nr:testis-expressed protein 51 isoform X1 [Oryctolagus cuniculus]